MTIEEVMTLKNWAVVGATTDETKYGYKIYKKLKKYDYNVMGITPKYDEIDGDKAYKTLFDLPKKPDVVNFVVNPKIGIEVIKACDELGIKNIWLQPGTVSEEILEYAKEHNINAIEACVLVVLNYQ